MNKYKLFWYIIKKCLPILKLPNNLKYEIYIDYDNNIVIKSVIPIKEEYEYISHKPLIYTIDEEFKIIGHKPIKKTETRNKYIRYKINL